MLKKLLKLRKFNFAKKQIMKEVPGHKPPHISESIENRYS